MRPVKESNQFADCDQYAISGHEFVSVANCLITHDRNISSAQLPHGGNAVPVTF